MSNMSYCRFTNTRQDMNDCLDALQAGKKLSDLEVRAGRNMFKDILEFCQEQGIIDTFDDATLTSRFGGLKEHMNDED